MLVDQVAYEAEGWGVGELVVADGRVVWHELPKPADGGSANGHHPVVELLQAYFAGEEVSLDEVPVDLEYDSPFFARCAEALRAVPRGEVVTYGELAALAGAPGAETDVLEAVLEAEAEAEAARDPQTVTKNRPDSASD